MKMKYADLHTHTFYSDGTNNPRQIVTDCAMIGMDVMAISDHDNTGGYREAKGEAEKWGIEISDAKRKQIEDVVMNAILWAEEKYGSRKGNIKLKAATGEIISEIQGMDMNEAEKLVHAMLPKVGLGRAVKKVKGSPSK